MVKDALSAACFEHRRHGSRLNNKFKPVGHKTGMGGQHRNAGIINVYAVHDQHGAAERNPQKRCISCLADFGRDMGALARIIGDTEMREHSGD